MRTLRNKLDSVLVALVVTREGSIAQWFRGIAQRRGGAPSDSRENTSELTKRVYDCENPLAGQHAIACI